MVIRRSNLAAVALLCLHALSVYGQAEKLVVRKAVTDEDRLYLMSPDGDLTVVPLREPSQAQHYYPMHAPFADAPLLQFGWDFHDAKCYQKVILPELEARKSGGVLLAIPVAEFAGTDRIWQIGSDGKPTLKINLRYSVDTHYLIDVVLQQAYWEMEPPPLRLISDLDVVQSTHMVFALWTARRVLSTKDRPPPELRIWDLHLGKHEDSKPDPMIVATPGAPTPFIVYRHEEKIFVSCSTGEDYFQSGNQLKFVRVRTPVLNESDQQPGKTGQLVLVHDKRKNCEACVRVLVHSDDKVESTSSPTLDEVSDVRRELIATAAATALRKMERHR
jgi:hypothetical protein